jgi:hypothetical protein
MNILYKIQNFLSSLIEPVLFRVALFILGLHWAWKIGSKVINWLSDDIFIYAFENAWVMKLIYNHIEPIYLEA